MSTSFSDIVSRLEKLPLHEVRKNTFGYFEFVIAIKNEKELYPIFELFFGPPFKPRNVNPDEKSKKITYNYGGIEKQQVLYYCEADGVSSCAMIWPWNNGELATVKIAQGHVQK